MNDFKQQLAPGWTPVNIGITVLFFILSWPIALLMVAYIIWGNRLGLNLGEPRTFSVFGQRLASAFRAAVEAFKKS